jgi:GDP-4-dehydro-6-deoxy-D-mannose reductase
LRYNANFRIALHNIAGTNLLVRILITGASGFAGQHLVRYLHTTQPQAELHGTTFHPDTLFKESVTYYELDLRDAAATHQLVAQIRPDVIYHLAGQASPKKSFDAPWETLEINIHSQLNLLEAVRLEELKPRILIVTSAEIYGTVRPDEMPLTEASPLRPVSPYSLSKITQDMMATQYFICYKMPIIRARAFNHTGAGQREDFVVASFAMQIARIEAGLQPPVISVGNLDAMRDFTDVRDTIRAYDLLTQHGIPGEAYNIASGKARSIDWVLKTLLSYANLSITIEHDPERMRPSEIPIIQGDSSKLRAITNWQPEILFEQTLRDILSDCRQRVQGHNRSN